MKCPICKNGNININVDGKHRAMCNDCLFSTPMMNSASGLSDMWYFLVRSIEYCEDMDRLIIGGILDGFRKKGQDGGLGFR